MTRLLPILALALLALTPHSPVITASDAGTTVSVKAGETFFIALAANPSTGYAWTQKLSGDAGLAYEGNVVENGAPMPGTPGQQLFIYTAGRTGTATIVLSYARPWETGVAAAKTVTFTIAVR